MTNTMINGLTDIQSTQDERGIAIQQVGVSKVEMPINIMQKNGSAQTVQALITMSVGLAKEEKGTHMSRFIKQLNASYKSKVFGFDLREFLEETCALLQTDTAHIQMGFNYFIDKKAPISGISAPMAHHVTFDATLTHKTDYDFKLGIVLPVANLCPCSKAISDYGAHNQRCEIRVKLQLFPSDNYKVVWIEDVLTALDECASCPVYPILKREDEKYVTERAYDNPKFVEDVIREAIITLRNMPGIAGFEVEVEAFESIHGHNAWAKHSELTSKH